MGTIRLYNIHQGNIGTQFILKDYPELQLFNNYAKRTEIKRLNVEQYFRGVGRNYMDYQKLVYGPVFGMDDARNGFLYEHNTTGELIIVDETDIPITYEVCDVLMGYLSGIYKDDIISKGIITSHNEMISLSNKVTNQTSYNDLIRDEWIPNKSFIIIE
jgi:hypothetical protein